MIPSISVSITLTDGRTLKASTTPRDLLAVERHIGKAVGAIFRDEPPLEAILVLAHSALARTGQWTQGFDALVDQMADIGTDEVSTAPFDGAPSEGTSPS